jgi:hypothetical protein
MSNIGLNAGRGAAVAFREKGNAAMSIGRKARANNRALALKPRPGRKPGATPLRKDKRRFEVAVFHALLTWAPTIPHALAAEIAVSFHDSIKISAVEKSGLVGLGFEYSAGRGEIASIRIVKGSVTIKYDPERKTGGRENRRDKILRDAPKLIEEAQGRNRLWLEVSARGLLGLLDAMTTVDENPEAMRYALKILAAVDSDWPRLLARLFQTHS